MDIESENIYAGSSRDEMESMRSKLLELLASKNNNCMDPDVQSASMQLDELIIIYLERMVK